MLCFSIVYGLSIDPSPSITGTLDFRVMVILVPYALDSFFASNSKRLAYVLALSAFGFLIIRAGVMDYRFMWQTY